MVWMLVGLLGFVCSCSKTDRARGAGKNNDEVRTITLPGGATMDLVWVEPGSFMMGSDAYGDGRSVHRVTLTKGYWIGKTEVTQKQWKSVVGNNPSFFKGDDLPVECVSWNDCQEFLAKVNLAHLRMRLALPTEAQWEFAARGGTKSKGYKYAGSDNCGRVAWHGDNAGEETHSVGTKAPNELGLYDMSGNVCERCADWLGDYPSGDVSNPTGPASGGDRVYRGGSWRNSSGFCCSAMRDGYSPDYRSSSLGFRVVASAEP